MLLCNLTTKLSIFLWSIQKLGSNSEGAWYFWHKRPKYNSNYNKHQHHLNCHFPSNTLKCNWMLKINLMLQCSAHTSHTHKQNCTGWTCIILIKVTFHSSLSQLLIWSVCGRWKETELFEADFLLLQLPLSLQLSILWS